MSLKQRVIDETVRMFLEFGIKSVRMDDIATNLGISKRTIYEVFGDKENLITETVRDYSQKMGERKREKLETASNIIEQFLMLLEDWDSGMDNNYRMMTSIRKYYPRIYETVSAENSEAGYAALREKLEEGVREGYLLSNINYELAVSVFSYSIFGIMNKQNMVLPNNVSEIDAFKYVITYFFRGVATEKGIRMIDEYIEKEVKKRNNQN